MLMGISIGDGVMDTRYHKHLTLLVGVSAPAGSNMLLAGKEIK
jgi:hypothetical protein